MVAHNPLNGSGRAGLPHPALASGDDAEAAQWVGMTDADRGQPAVYESQHTVPSKAAILATPRQRAVPEPTHAEPKQVERWSVHGNPIVTSVPFHHRSQPLTYLRDGVVHASLELGFHLAQLGLQPLAYRLPEHREPAVAPLLPADVGEAEEVEGLGLALAAPLSVPSRKWAELQQAGFVGMQLQSELPKSFDEFFPKPLGIRPLLESEHDVIGEPDDNHVAAGILAAPKRAAAISGQER